LKNFYFNYLNIVEKTRVIEDLNFKLELNSYRHEITNYNNEKLTISKILIVDDNQLLNDSLKRILNGILMEHSLKFEIKTLTDGLDLINEVIKDTEQGNRIKCIFTDENMDFINGSEAIKILRNLESKNKIKNIKIVSITCHEEKEILENILNSGADMVIIKPASKDKIFSSLLNSKII